MHAKESEAAHEWAGRVDGNRRLRLTRVRGGLLAVTPLAVFRAQLINESFQFTLGGLNSRLSFLPCPLGAWFKVFV